MKKDPNDPEKVIIQFRSGDRCEDTPILKKDISLITFYPSDLRHPKNWVFINEFEMIPNKFIRNIQINNPIFNNPDLRGKYSDMLQHSEKYSSTEIDHAYHKLLEYDTYGGVHIETQSTVDTILNLLGRDAFLEIPSFWKLDWYNCRDFYMIFSGWYRAKKARPAVIPKKKSTHSKKHEEKKPMDRNLNLDIDSLVEKIVSGVLDRIFAFGNIKGNQSIKTSLPPTIEDAEIVKATEEVCKSLIPVARQKDVKALVVRKLKNELVKRH